MKLLSDGVGVHHVNKLMTHVADLCGKKLSKLPLIGLGIRELVYRTNILLRIPRPK